MKRILTIIAIAFLSFGTLFAQERIIFYNGANPIHTQMIENVDSVSFVNNISIVHNNIGETNFQFPVIGIDSIVFSDEEVQVDTGDIIYITYNGNSASIINPWANRGVTVTANGADVTVMAASGTPNIIYYLSGTTADGSLFIQSDRRLNLILHGVSITNPTGNPDLNVDSLRQRFFDAHYGPNRTPFITQYYDEMQEALLASGQKLNIYGYPMDAVEGYLNLEHLAVYSAWLWKAWNKEPFEGCSSLQKKMYDDRLRLLQLSFDFAVLDIASHEYFPEINFFTEDEKKRKQVSDVYHLTLDNFVKFCNILGINYLDEATYTPQQFYDNITNYWEKARKRASARANV